MGRTAGRDRALRLGGLSLVVVGLVLLGYVAWQLYGTNVVSRRAQAEAVEQVQRVWAEREAPTEPQGEKPATKPGEPTALLRIPKFGEDYVMPVFAGVEDDVLAKGYGHFEGATGPGQPGNYALAAHRVTHGEPLRRMPELRPGDTIVVETATHTYTYELDTDPNDLVVAFDQIWVIDALPDNPDPNGPEPPQRPGSRLITLTTCAELFHTDERMIAFGHLVGTARKGA